MRLHLGSSALSLTLEYFEPEYDFDYQSSCLTQFMNQRKCGRAFTLQGLQVNRAYKLLLSSNSRYYKIKYLDTTPLEKSGRRAGK